MCGVDRTVTDVADSNLCGEDDCYKEDMAANGWRCCRCETENYGGSQTCTTPVQDMDRIVPCNHNVDTPSEVSFCYSFID
jgi:hypothetical protein